DPKAIIPAGDTALASGTLHLDRLPETIQNLALRNVEVQLKRAERQIPPNLSEARRKLRKEFLKDVAATAEAVIKEGKDVTVQLAIDPKAQKATAEISLSARADSDLAKKMANLGKATSLFAGLGGSDSAAGGLFRYTLPENVRKALGALADQTIKDVEEKEQDEGKRDLVVRFLKAVAPSVKAGEIDSALNLLGPSRTKKYTVVGGVRMKDAAGVEKVLRDIVKVIPKQDQAKVKMDADKEGGIAIHRLDIKDKLDKQGKSVLGNASLYLAFRKDA